LRVGGEEEVVEGEELGGGEGQRENAECRMQNAECRKPAG